MTISDDARSVLEKLTAGLPPSFLALVLLNALLTGILLFVLSNIATVRIASMEKVLVACVAGLQGSAPAR